MTYGSSYSGAPQQNSTNATISLIAGILGLTFFPGYRKHHCRDHRHGGEERNPGCPGGSGTTLEGEGMATAGSIMGWIGIALGVIACCVLSVRFILFFLLFSFPWGSHSNSSWLPLLFTI